MTELTVKYLMLWDNISEGKRNNTRFAESEAYDILANELDQIARMLTPEEVSTVHQQLKERGPAPVVITRADMGLSPIKL